MAGSPNINDLSAPFHHAKASGKHHPPGVRLLVGLLFAGSALAQCTGYSGSLTVDINRLRLPVTETSFTVLLQGTNATLATQANGGQLQSGNGYDICYSDLNNTTTYAWRLLAYTATTGFFSHRVLVPAVNGTTASQDTQFLMWYGQSGASAPTGNPFNSTALLAVDWGNGSSLDLTDWTGNCASPTNHGVTAAAGPLTGQGGANFVTNQYVDWGCPMNTGGGSVTVAGWANIGSSALARFFSNYNSSSPYGGFLVDVGDGVRAAVRLFLFDSSNHYSYMGTANGAFPTGGWHYFVATADSAASGHFHIYVDGAAKTADNVGYNAASLGNSTNRGASGHDIGGATFYTGQQGPFRITNGLWDQNYVTAVYNNESSPSTFFSFAVPTVRPLGPAVSGVSCSANSPTSALCSWTTDTPGDSQVVCGTAAGDGINPGGTVYSTPIVQPVRIGVSNYFGVISHSMAITGLPNNTSPTAYYCIVKSSNIQGGPLASAEVTTGTTAALTSTPFVLNSVSPPIRPNDQANGANGMPNNGFWVDGDTNYCTLTASGRTICSCEDCGSVRNTHSENTNFLSWDAPHLTATHITGYNGSSFFSVVPNAHFGTMGPINVNGSTYIADGIFAGNNLDGGLCCFQLMRSKDGLATSIGLHHNTGSSATGVSGADLAPVVPITGASVSGTTVTLTTTANLPVGTPIAVINVTCNPASPCVNTGLELGAGNVASVATSSPTQLTYAWAGASGATVSSTAGAMVNATTFNGLMLVHWIQCDGAEYACTKYAGMDGWVYTHLSVGFVNGVVLARIRIEDLDLLDWSKFQLYVGARSGDDGIYDSAWDSSANKLSKATQFTEQPYYWRPIGSCKPSAAFVPDFDRWLLACGVDRYGGVTSVGAQVYDLQYPWSLPNYAGQIQRDILHFPYYLPGFPTLLPGSYQKTSSRPLMASATILTSGLASFYMGDLGTGANDNYTTWLRRVTLVPAGPSAIQSRFGRGRRRHNPTGLDLAYFFTDNVTGSRTLKDSSPGGRYTVTGIGDASVLAIDQYGLFNGGLPNGNGSYPVWASPVNYSLTTPYTAALGAFTNETCFGHVPGANVQPRVAGEIVVNKNNDFQIARHGTTDTWDVIVRGTVIGSVPIADGGFGCIVTTRDAAGNVSLYQSGDVQTTLPLTPTATGTAAGTFSGAALVLGDPTNSFHGILVLEMWRNRLLLPEELINELSATRFELESRGISIP